MLNAVIKLENFTTVEKAVHLTRSFEVVNIKAILEKLRRQMSVNASHSCPIISHYNNLKL